MAARRMTRYQKKRARKAGRCFAVVLALTLAIVCGVLIYRNFMPGGAPDANVHDKDDLGYIPVSGDMLSVSVSAPHVFVYDCNEGEIIYRKGHEKVLYPASTTKLLTILCALEHLSPTDIITPGEELSLVEEGSSIAYINKNHKLTVEMLIEGMLLPSGNDAAYVLAAAAGNRMSDGEAMGVEAVEVFMDGMAQYARTLGLNGTHFITPDGLAGTDHYSTLEDMLLIARAAADHEIITRYAGLYRDSVTYASGHTNTWVNTNVMLDPSSTYYRPCVTGLKTGSLDKNYCLITTVEQAGSRYIVGVFGAATKTARFADTAAIIDCLFPTKEVTS